MSRNMLFNKGNKIQRGSFKLKRLLHKATMMGAAVAIAMVPFVMTGALPSAEAVAGADPLASASLDVVYDGTDQGTLSGTFINTENGYVPGDDTPTDGIVSSNDYVGYEWNTSIKAGPARSVDVTLEVPEYLEFVEDLNPGICITNQFVTGKFTGTEEAPKCTYEAKRGTPVTISVPILLVAKDTAGTIKTGQELVTSVGLTGDQAYSSSEAPAITVVSAPAADLVIRPEQCSVDGRCSSGSPTAEASGVFFITPEALSYEDYLTTKGSSIAGEYTAAVDVSDFPVGTTWTYAGEQLVLSGAGVVSLPSKNGVQQLRFTMPAGWENQFEEGDSATYKVGMTVPDTAFATDDFDNNTDGWQPGDGETSSYSTLNDRQTGARKGYRAANNDYTEWEFYKKPSPGPGAVFAKVLERPWSSSETYWEDGRKSFASGAARAAGSSETRLVDQGTELRASLHVTTSNRLDDAATTFVVSDTWDPAEQSVTGPVTVIAPDESVMADGYTVQWSLTATGEETADPASNSGWITTLEPPTGAKAVRVILHDLPTGSQAGAGNFKVQVPLKVVDDWSGRADIEAPIYDSMYAQIGDEEFGPYKRYVTPVFPGDPAPALTFEAEQEMVDLQTRLSEWSIVPSVSGLMSSRDTVNGTVTLSLDACVTSFNLGNGSAWVIDTPFVKGTGCGADTATQGSVTLKLADANGVVPVSSKDEWLLPEINFSSRIGALSLGNISMLALFELTHAGQQSIETVDPAVATAETSIQRISATSEMLTPLTPLEELDEPLVWEVLTSAMTDTGEEGLASQTVVVLPGRGGTAEAAYVTRTGFEDYSGATSSTIDGDYLLDSVNILTDDSDQGSTIMYTRTLNPSLDPAGSYWSADATDSLSNPITAILIDNPGGGVGITTAEITINPTGNKKDNNYLMWIGPVTINDEAHAQAWPAEAKILASEVSGYVYWDSSGKGDAYNEDSMGIEDVKVELLRDGSVIGTVMTDDEGYYEFTNLKSGDYTTRIPAIGAPDGVPSTQPSYFYEGEQIQVVQTHSYRSKRLGASKTDSDKIDVDIDTRVEHVNYGFVALDPYSDLKKDAAQVICADDDAKVCDIEWEITVKNDKPPAGYASPVTLTGGRLTDTTSSEVYDMSVTAGLFENMQISQVSAGSNHTLVIDGNGDVWAWGQGDQGQLGTGSNAEQYFPKK